MLEVGVLLLKLSQLLSTPQKDLPFLDVELEEDNRLFIDPRAIRLEACKEENAAMSYATKATVFLDSFFQVITDGVLSPQKSETAKRAQNLLRHFEEPNETRLGLSANDPEGKGGGEVVGRNIWDTLSTKLVALIRIGLLKRAEEINVFVPKVGPDITSDISTRIIFKVLVDFTEEMMNKFPALKDSAKETKPMKAWDPTTKVWSELPRLLPHDAKGRPFLLVPKTWARPNLVFSREKYFQNGCLTYVQEKIGSRDSTGKLTPTKKDLRQRAEYMCNLPNLVQVTLEAHKDGENLVEYVLEIMDGKYKLLTDDELEERLS